ncbi:MAG: transporter substrate-binding domain-containing protein [Candidatus Binatia bacterium]
MSRWSVAVALLVSAAVASCSLVRSEPPAAVSASPVIDRITQRGELRVGTSGHQPPLTAVAKDGSLIGFDIDLARALAEAMGAKLTLVQMPFADLLPALKRGELDMVLSGLTMTPQRNLQVAFVGPYLVSGMSILTKSKTMANLRKAEEIDTPDVSLAVLSSSTAVKFAQDAVPKAKLVTVATLDEGVELVRQGKVDALLADHPFCEVTVYRYRNDDLATLETPFTFEPLGIALPPNDALLINWTQNALADLDDSGAIYDMMYQWFEKDDWVQQLR